MTDTTDPASPAARPAVAADMAAIFGEGQRVEPRRTPAPPPPAMAARRGVRPGVAMLFLGALGVSIAGGAMLGRDAATPAAPAPALASRSAAPPRAATLPPAAEPAALSPVALPPVAPPAIAPPTMVAAAAPMASLPATSLPAAQPMTGSRRATVPAPVVQDRDPAPVPATYARAEPARMARTRCFGDEDCLNVRLYDTDGEVARAYQAATEAGVPPSTLREYRSEWLRARDVAARRPREALRIYGMIAADLFDLAEDARADDRMPRS